MSLRCMGGAFTHLDPTQASRALYTAVIELQMAVEVTRLNKEDCREICCAVVSLAPLYGRILQLLESGVVDDAFDAWFRGVMHEGLGRLEGAKDAVYRFVLMNPFARLAKAAGVQQTLQRTHQAIRDSQQAINTYLTAAGMQLQLHSGEELRQLSQAAREVVQHLGSMARAPFQEGSQEVVKAVALLSVGTDRQRERGVAKMLQLVEAGHAAELVRCGTVSALWRCRQGLQFPQVLELVRHLVDAPDGRQHIERCGGEAAMCELCCRQLLALRGHGFAVRALGFSPDGSLLASGSDDRTLRLWDASSGRCALTLEGHRDGVCGVCFLPDGQLLASGSDDAAVRLWDPSSGRCVATLEGHRGWVRTVCASPHGELLASGGEDKTLRLWDVSRRSCVATLQGHTGGVLTSCFSPDGRLLLSGSDDATLRLWDPSSGQCTATLEGHNGLVTGACFCADGKLLASASDGWLRLWDPSSGRSVAVLEGHTRAVRTMCSSPDGTFLASGAEDQTLRLWDVGSRRSVAVLEGHTAWVYSSCFSPDGKLLASGSGDNTLRLWDSRGPFSKG